MQTAYCLFVFFFSSRRRHTRCSRDWSSDVCSSDLDAARAARRVSRRQRVYFPSGTPPRGRGREACPADTRLTARDRKSTRLNSSHGYISYAVFCLKKKKKQ